MSKAPSKEVWVAINTTWNVFNFRRGLLTALGAAGFRVTAYAPPDDYIGRVESCGVRYVPMQLNNAGTNPLRELMTLWQMVRLLGRERPALLLTYTPKVNIYLALVARVWGIPVVANVSGLGRTFIAGGWLNRIARVLYRIAFSWPKCIFFQNAEDRAVFLDAGLVRAEQTALLPGSGVDVSRFSPRRNAREGGAFVFLLVARLMWDKGVGEYIAAARQLKAEFPAVSFRLLGFLDVPSPSAVTRAEVDAWVHEGVIEYLGHSDDTVSIYAEADCVVLPSYREGMPKTLLEAASMALPTIATDVPGCRQAVLDGETGLLCKVRDSTALAEAMRRMLLLSAKERAQMGKAARERIIREFDEKIVIQKYLVAIGKVLSGQSE
ncbi:glycosyltransferase family 4 protein [Propionivibrio sp.]|uniref:glycosyltransferase family 4 protein n=1 Tax=Propionivibrio sp. TaxID=2212460 RepID=UPI002638E033|nr:glycosyltransferase family 4 protein [Propionivibrio sp.]